MVQLPGGYMGIFLKKNRKSQSSSKENKVYFKKALQQKQLLSESENSVAAINYQENLSLKIEENKIKEEVYQEIKDQEIIDSLIEENIVLKIPSNFKNNNRLEETIKIINNSFDNVVKQNLIIAQAIDDMIIGIENNRTIIEEVNLILDLTKKTVRKANILALNAFIEIAGNQEMKGSEIDNNLNSIRKTLQFISDYLCQITNSTTSVISALNKQVEDIQNATIAVVPEYINARQEIIDSVSSAISYEEEISS